MRFLLLLVIAVRVYGCSCGGNWPSVKQTWAEAPAVFLGTVELADPDGDPRQTIFQNQSVRIRVDEAFKGVKVGQKIDLHQYGNDCEAKFRTGQRAVFYLQTDKDGSLYVPYCTRSLGDAAPNGDDLLFLHKLPKSGIGTRLSGEVELYEDSPRQAFKRVGGVPNVPVEISAESGAKLATKTNSAGTYEVYNLRPGKYTVSIAVPKGLKTTFSTVEGLPKFRTQAEAELASRDTPTLELMKNGGVSVNFVLKADTRLSGHLLDENGVPKQGVCIDLEPQEGRGENGAYFFDCSKEDGSFQMEMMPPGKYWLIARDEVKSGQFKSTSTLYYPGFRDRNNAKAFSIEAGKYLKGLDIKLPANELRHQLSGRMQFEDGASAPNGSVTFTSPEHGYTEKTEIAADGSFTLLIIAGMKGQLDGTWGVLLPMLTSCPELKLGPKRAGMFRSIEAEPLAVSGDADHPNLKLVLPSPSCKALLQPTSR